MELNPEQAFALHFDTHCDFVKPNGVINTVYGLEPSLVFGSKITVGFKKFNPDEVKLLLRPLSDMTEDECEQYNQIFGTMRSLNKLQDQMLTEAAAVRFLITKHFDVYGLIDKGIALDKVKYYEAGATQK